MELRRSCFPFWYRRLARPADVHTRARGRTKLRRLIDFASYFSRFKNGRLTSRPHNIRWYAVEENAKPAAMGGRDAAGFWRVGELGGAPVRVVARKGARRAEAEHHFHPRGRHGLWRSRLLRAKKDQDAESGPDGRRRDAFHAVLRGEHGLRAFAFRAVDRTAHRPYAHPRQPGIS